MSTRTVKITSGQTLQSFLSEVVAEGAKSALAQKALEEKEKQGQLSSSDGDDEGGTDIFSSGSDGDNTDSSKNGGGSPEGGNGSSKTMDDETEKLKQGDVEPKDVVEKLNSIRSGRSFKDSAVAQPMEDYITSLSKAERVALFAFLKGISQIVTGEVPAQAAEDPSKHPADVKMDKSNEPHVKHVKPNLINGPQQSAGATKAGGKPTEDTSAPRRIAPITPKKR